MMIGPRDSNYFSRWKKSREEWRRICSLCWRAERGGYTVKDPKSTYIDEGVFIGSGTVIWPNTEISQGSFIGRDCDVGSSIISESVLGDNVRVERSEIRKSKIGNNSNIEESKIMMDSMAGDNVVGEARIFRSIIGIGTRLIRTEITDSSAGENCIIGPMQIVRSTVGWNVRAKHHGYIGDASIGNGVNWGAGAITANYDGKKKHRTVVGPGAMLGCNVVLIAKDPELSIGAGTIVAAGSIITKDVPVDSLVITRSRQVVKKDWKKRKKRGTAPARPKQPDVPPHLL